jgi:hypothetical protein
MSGRSNLGVRTLPATSTNFCAALCRPNGSLRRTLLCALGADVENLITVEQFASLGTKDKWARKPPPLVSTPYPRKGRKLISLPRLLDGRKRTRTKASNVLSL